jgi:hypothetical protein
MLCEAVQGEFQTQIHWKTIGYLQILFCLARNQPRIHDNDPGFEHENWMKRKKPSEPEEPLQADRWFSKNMDHERDNPEQSGMYLNFQITYATYLYQITYAT